MRSPLRALLPALLVGPALILAFARCGGGGGQAASTPAATAPAPVPGAPRLPATPVDYVGYAVTSLPAHFRNPTPAGSAVDADNTPADNPITNAGATLGRVLFYDKHLSANDTISCGSCHKQAVGFSDSARLSRGFQGGSTARHAMGLSQARFYQRGRFFWDERAATLEDQVLQPIQNATEMGLDLPTLLAKVNAQAYYPALFQAAFGTSEVSTDRIAKALAQFIRAMVSYQSKYDRAFAPNGIPNFAATFTAQELQGQQLFGGGGAGPGLGCIGCHDTTAQIALRPENNGLDAVITDAGVGAGRFKVPSLRNIGARAPYMHDGRFADLDAVLEHYSSGIQDNPGLSPRLRVGGDPAGAPVRLNLTAEQKAALKAFLLTLTDATFLTDGRFSDPF